MRASVFLPLLALGCGAEPARAVAVSPAQPVAAAPDGPSIGLRVAAFGDGPISDAALSPDGTWLATATGAEVVVWDVATGARRFSRRLSEAPKWLAASPDGADLLSAEGRLRASDGEPVPKPAEWPTKGRDGERVDTVSWASLPVDRRIALERWARANGAKVTRAGSRIVLQAPESGLWASVDRAVVATARAALRVDLGRVIPAPAPAGTPCEPVVGPDPDRMVFVVGTSDTFEATLWDTRTGARLGSLGAVCEAEDLTWSPRGRWIFSRDCDGRRRWVHDARTAELLGSVAAEALVGVSMDERRFAVRSAGGAAVHELPSLARALLAPGLGEPARAVAFSRTGDRLFALRDDELQAFRLSDGQLVARTRVQVEARTAFRPTSRPGGLVVASPLALEVLDEATLAVRRRVRLQGGADTSGDGSRIVAARAGSLEIVDGASSRRVAHDAVHGDAIAAHVAVSPDGTKAAAIFDGGAVELDDLTAGRASAQLESATPGFAARLPVFDAAGVRLAYARVDVHADEVIVWDLDARRRVAHDGAAEALAFGDGGALLEQRGAALWMEDLASGDRRRRALPPWAASPQPSLPALAAVDASRWFPEGELGADATGGVLSPDGAWIAWIEDGAVLLRRRAPTARPVALYAFQVGRDASWLAVRGVPRARGWIVGGACGWDGAPGAERFLRGIPPEPGAPAPDVERCRRPGLLAEPGR